MSLLSLRYSITSTGSMSVVCVVLVVFSLGWWCYKEVDLHRANLLATKPCGPGGSTPAQIHRPCCQGEDGSGWFKKIPTRPAPFFSGLEWVGSLFGELPTRPAPFQIIGSWVGAGLIVGRPMGLTSEIRIEYFMGARVGICGSGLIANAQSMM